MYLTWKIYMNFIVCSISFLGNKILAIFCYRILIGILILATENKAGRNWEETVVSWRRGCTHLVTRDLTFRINIHQNKLVSQLHPAAVCSDFYTIVNRWCASLNYWIVPIFNSQSAYALFTQHTKWQQFFHWTTGHQEFSFRNSYAWRKLQCLP